jgi:DNA-binding SARP family transcriptional activator
MALLQLQLAHHASVRAAGLTLELAPRDAALLAWLALEGPTPRVRLASLLWPDSEPVAARNALRQRLFQLKRQLGAELVTGTATLALAAFVQHDLDDSDGVLGAAPHDHSAEFVAWLAQQRERRRARTRSALVDLAEMAEAAKDFDDALAHARELLALEPLSEDAHRRVMRLHYLAGDRAAALLAFDRCEQVLKDEVGARPSAQTLALLETISAHAPAALPAHAAVPAAVLRPPRLVGRDRDRAALAQAWQAGHVVALIGEAGLGKTRLLHEFIDRRPGFVHVAGRPGDSGVPFATLARLLRAIVAQDHDAAQVQLPAPTRSEIARVLPEFDGGLARQAGEGQRLVLLRAVRALLAAHERIDTVAVDDLHFADEASIDMLGSLIDGDDEGTGSRWRWVLAYRPAEAGSAVQALHDRLVEQVRLVPLILAPLDQAALAELVDSLALPGIDGRVLAPGLLRRTGGNPLFVLETLKQAWVEQSLAQLADANAMPRPLSVGRLIERRVAQLSPRALAVARVAAIARVDFGVALAEHVLQAPAIALADAIGELEAAQVMRADAFAHDLVADAVRASVPATVAAHTHAQVALWLEQHGGEPARVARHWIEGGQGARALPWLARAADAAGAAVRRKEQVAFWLEKGHIEAAQGDRAAAFESLMRAAEFAVTLDQEGGSQGLEICERLDALADGPAQRVRAHTQRANLAIMQGDPALAEATATAALREALRHGVAQSIVIECRHQLATALGILERLPEAIAQFEAMLGWIDEHAGDEQRCEFHGNLAMVYDQAGQIAASVPHHEVAIELSRRIAHHGNFVMCTSNFAANRIIGGQLEEGAALLERARQARARDETSSSIDGFIAMNQAICDYQSGRYRDALQALDDSSGSLAQFAPGYRRFAALHRAVCWAQLGQWTRLRQAIESLGDLSALPGSARCRVLTLQHAMARALSSQPVSAPLVESLRLAMHNKFPDVAHAAMLELAATQPPAQGLRDCEAVIAEAGRLGHAGTLVAAHALAARCAAQLDDVAGARRHAGRMHALGTQVRVVRQYAMEPCLNAALALQRADDELAARQTCERACAWIETTARRQVPPEFRDGFLHRNPVNRELLALAARLAPR